MSRTPRGEVFDPRQIATVHVMNRVVRRCFLMGFDTVSGQDYGHRQDWLEAELERVAAGFGIDCLNFAILSNHFHLILRSRPDVVATWDDLEVARRWLMLCPIRTHKDGSAKEPTESELNSIATDPVQLAEVRLRLSDISWWMRLVCQRIAQRANLEDDQSGKFWQARFKAVRLLDEQAILAGAAYVDLNPIRAALTETLELSDHTSVQRRIEGLRSHLALVSEDGLQPAELPDAFLAPLEIDEREDELGPRPSTTAKRSSDKGFLAMSLTAYLELLDWTARQLAPGKRGATPHHAPPILERLKLEPEVWRELVSGFGKLFSLAAGLPEHIDSHRGGKRGGRFHVPRATRQLLHG